MDVGYNRTGDVSSEHVCEWTAYCTHHNDMYVPQCVHVYEPLGYLGHWTFYCTHHSDTDAPQYVHVDDT
jgi:hypothetical protein